MKFVRHTAQCIFSSSAVTLTGNFLLLVFSVPRNEQNLYGWKNRVPQKDTRKKRAKMKSSDEKISNKCILLVATDDCLLFKVYAVY